MQHHILYRFQAKTYLSFAKILSQAEVLMTQAKKAREEVLTQDCGK